MCFVPGSISRVSSSISLPTFSSINHHPSFKFFATIRNIGLAVAAISGSILAAPVALPVVVVKIAGYLAGAGGIASAVSQATTAQDEPVK